MPVSPSPLTPRAGAVVLSLALAGCAVGPTTAPRVAAGITSQQLCTGVFTSGQPPETVFQENVLGLPGMGWTEPLLSFDVDQAGRSVSARFLGGFERRAVWRDGYGCVLLPEGAPPPAFRAPAPVAFESPWPGLDAAAPVEPGPGPWRDLLDHAFTDTPSPPHHRTMAVLVVHRDRIVAERYAPGHGVDTAMPSWSVAKSISHALTGTLVAAGRVAPDEPTGLPAWAGPGDPRAAITVDMLLRQTSGLALTHMPTAFDPSTRMKYLEADPAGFASATPLDAPPGTRWAYADGHFTLLSRVLRDRLGGHAEDVARHARAALFGPLGMAHTTVEFDVTGTPLGAHAFSASARDYARLGLLYLHDGMAGDRRVLPAGWVARARTPTPGTGYGAGFYVNVREGDVPGWGVPWGLPHAPRDTFFARGFMGQYVVIVPSLDLVVVRLGPSQVEGDDIRFMDTVMRDAVVALGK